MPEQGPPVLDVRTYKCVPGGRDELVRIMADGTVPMLRRDGIEVLAYGPSLRDGDHAFLIRRFPSAAVREEQLERFYGSDEFVSTYEEQVMALIDAYHVVVIPASPELESALVP
jgi:NIPSNAP